MLRQVYILKDDKILYNKDFGKALTMEDFNKVYAEITSGIGIELDSYDFIKYRIVFTIDDEAGLTSIFVIDINDDLSQAKTQLKTLQKEFIETFGDNIDDSG